MGTCREHSVEIKGISPTCRSLGEALKAQIVALLRTPTGLNTSAPRPYVNASYREQTQSPARRGCARGA